MVSERWARLMHWEWSDKKEWVKVLEHLQRTLHSRLCERSKQVLNRATLHFHELEIDWASHDAQLVHQFHGLKKAGQLTLHTCNRSRNLSAGLTRGKDGFALHHTKLRICPEILRLGTKSGGRWGSVLYPLHCKHRWIDCVTQKSWWRIWEY